MTQYHDGQRLTAANLRDDFARESELRYRHVVALHAAWGIAFGLDVQLGANRTVTVAPGVAYDRCGREMLLADAATVDVPALLPAAGLLLAIRWAAGANGADGGGVCIVGEPVAALAQYELVWRRADELRTGDEIVLARVFGTTTLTVGRTPVRYVRRSQRPQVSTGIVTASWDRWRVWGTNPGLPGQPLGVELSIDTSAAGFTAPPAYFVRASHTTPAESGLPRMAAMFPSVTGVTRTGFTFRLLFAWRTAELPLDYRHSLSGTPTIFWTGVARSAGSEDCS